MAEHKLAAIGDRDSVMLWRALGVETVFAETPLAITREIDRLAKEGTAVIYITERAAKLVPEAIERYLSEPFPAIIPIPSSEGSTSFGLTGIRKNVEKAIGADILFSNEEDHAPQQ